MYIFQYISKNPELLSTPHGICVFIIVMPHTGLTDTFTKLVSLINVKLFMLIRYNSSNPTFLRNTLITSKKAYYGVCGFS